MVRSNWANATALARWKRRRRFSMSSLLFILPPLIVYVSFVAYPFVHTVLISFTNWDGLSAERQWVGFGNYAAALLEDRQFWRAFGNNIWWVILGTTAPIIIALPLAALVTARKLKGRNFFRTVFFMPVILPPMIVGIIWGWVYNPVFGLLNEVLEAIGLEVFTRPWLGDPNLALTSLIASAVWAYFGFCFVIFVAAQQNVDVSLLEAAEIDGANSRQRFMKVTIPQLRDVITMVGVYTFIGGFTSIFDIIWGTTRGGPAGATEVLTTLIYRRGFEYHRFGYASAIAVILAVVVIVSSVVSVRLRERKA